MVRVYAPVMVHPTGYTPAHHRQILRLVVKLLTASCFLRPMIELDGSYGEGGGALTRIALALSTLTSQPFRVTNIRAGRKDAGLKAQHLTAIRALKEICDAETNEIQLGSTELTFIPGKIKSGRYEFNIGTAGSISLFLQALVLPSLFAPGTTTITISGGTSGKWASSVDYWQNVVVPQLQRFVEKMEIRLLQRGYYPEGGGKVEVKITPKYQLSDFSAFPDFSAHLNSKIKPLFLDQQGTLEQIRGLVNVSAPLQEKRVAERIRASAEMMLQKYRVPLNIRVEYAPTRSLGGEIVLWAVFSEQGKSEQGKTPDVNRAILGADVLVEKGKTSEEIGKEAAEKLIREIDSGAAVDIHAEDQLIPFLALLPGSTIKVREVTNHTLTNIYVGEKFLPVRLVVEGDTITVKQG